jgi:hypothetical protein
VVLQVAGSLAVALDVLSTVLRSSKFDSVCALRHTCCYRRIKKFLTTCRKVP